MAAPKTLRPILVGGLIAGVLDITYAFVFGYVRSGRAPAFILQSVASGALGRSAFEGGWKTAALGLALHFLIALIAATVFVLASRIFRFMVSHAVVSGVLYGLCVFGFMYGFVLRVSAIQLVIWPWALPKPVLIGGLLIHMFGVGLPLALVNRHYSK